MDKIKIICHLKQCTFYIFVTLCIYLYNDDNKKKFACLSRQLTMIGYKSRQRLFQQHRTVSKFIIQVYHLLFGCFWLSEQYKNAKSPAVVVFSKILLWHFRVIFIIIQKSSLLSFQTRMKKKKYKNIRWISADYPMCSMHESKIAMGMYLQWLTLGKECFN